ncbi:hypothetical protein GCM10025875_06220 [Litorihabitans aurantiacus]|uniref:TIGR03089 family protein n=1 Tax=Litorihabitans aurantiacus TaxID=1930061 RepID=A0AA37XD18_9MICO|nr:hypothetical protein GCM10025875_06220 [Litorihabitans aurantiacus]
MSINPRDLHRRLLADGPLPRLSWTSADGEALELSGRVLGNWTSKIANLLVEEVDAGPGTRVALDLPVHWRTLVWALGAWVSGAGVLVVGGDEGDGGAVAGPVDVVATTRPEAWTSRADVVVAVPLPSFALRWPGELPAGALDGGSDVAVQPDALGPVVGIDAGAVALEVGGSRVTFAQLAAGAANPGARSRRASCARLRPWPVTASWRWRGDTGRPRSGTLTDHARNHSRRRLRHPAPPDHAGREQAARPGVRQADDLLPALDPPAGGDQGRADHHHPARRRPVPAAAG